MNRDLLMIATSRSTTAAVFEVDIMQKVIEPTHFLVLLLLMFLNLGHAGKYIY